MAKIKSSNTNTTKKTPTKFMDRYPDLFFMRDNPIPDIVKERIALEMVEFADRETTLRADDFWIEKKMNDAYYYRWKETYPDLERAHDYLLMQCASRREHGAMNRKFDGNYIEKTQPMYDKKYKALVEWRASLNKDNAANKGNVTVVIEAMPETNVVPVKTKDE